MPDDPTAAEQAVAATVASTPPVGISSTHILIVAMSAIIIFGGVAAWILTHSPDASDRASILQASIAMASLAFGYFLGSSASSRNKDQRPVA